MPDDFGRRLYVCTCKTKVRLASSEVVAWKVAHGALCPTEDVNKKSVLTDIDGQ